MVVFNLTKDFQKRKSTNRRPGELSERTNKKDMFMK